MAKRSKLLQALDAHKGRDFEAEKQKKMIKTAEKKKASKKSASVPEDKPAVEEKKEEEEVASSDAEEEEEEEEVDEDEEMEDEEEEEDIPLSDLEEDEREDVVPHQRLTINNSAAIKAALKRISFIGPQTPFSEHNSLVSTEPIEIEDPNDDLNRELAFYKVCQAAATDARGLLKKEGIPFTRPGDYFAEMVKNDEHMGLIKKKLYEEAAGKKAAAEARRQRDLKKFGKQVQNAKLQQRHKEKREMLEKIETLKKSTYRLSKLPLQKSTNTNFPKQSARLTALPLPMTPMICSILPLTKPASPRRSVAVTVVASARRRTPSSDSEARSAMLRAVMLLPVVT
jgi:rRNA-processing protein EBP2